MGVVQIQAELAAQVPEHRLPPDYIHYASHKMDIHNTLIKGGVAHFCGLSCKIGLLKVIHHVLTCFSPSAKKLNCYSTCEHGHILE
jgi:hypothetical protein